MNAFQGLLMGAVMPCSQHSVHRQCTKEAAGMIMIAAVTATPLPRTPATHLLPHLRTPSAPSPQAENFDRKDLVFMMGKQY